MKNCLFKIRGRGRLDYFTLLTVLSDIQRSVNNRPLTYQVSADKNATPITPNMFLKPNQSPGLLIRLDREDRTTLLPPSRERLIQTLELRDQCLTDFHKLWYEEYLLELGRKIPGRSRLSTRTRLQKDDVVLIKSPLKPRPFWVLGTITELIPGHDGVVRAARVQKGEGLEEVHSLKHLYPLELSRTPEGPPVAEGGETLDSPPSVEEQVWLCPLCSSPQQNQNMIGCDSCDDWYHFRCVGIDSEPPNRQKWYCPECAPLKKRRGRPSLLPA